MSHPYHLQDHPSIRGMAKLVAAMDAGKLEGYELIAAVHILLKDRWHQELMAQREKRLRLQTKYAKASIKLRLKAIRQQKKIANKRLAVAANIAKAAEEKNILPPLPKVTLSAVSPSAYANSLREKFGIAQGGVERDSRAQKPNSTTNSESWASPSVKPDNSYPSNDGMPSLHNSKYISQNSPPPP